MDVCQRLAENVKRLRKLKGISQEELADQAKVHRTYMSDIERGVRNPSIKVVERMGEALGVTASQLLDIPV